MVDKMECHVDIENKRKFNVEVYPQESLRFYCNHCRAHTSHRTVAKASEHSEDASGNFHLWESYRIVECAGCHSVRFIEQAISSEDDDYYDQDDSCARHCYIYPISEEGALTESRLHELEFVLPPNVKKIYEEALIAIKNKLFILAGIGLRSILDSICLEKGIVGKEKNDLFHRIETMYNDLHLITKDEKDVLHVVRAFGNKSAHEGGRLSSYEVSSALIVVEHLLDKLYLLPEIKKEFDEGKEKIDFVDEVFPDNGEAQ